MAIPYPPLMRGPVRASKARRQIAAFSASDPLEGFAYTQKSGEDQPVVWDALFRFSADDATRFQLWFTEDLQRGLLPFELPIKVEGGMVTATCRFMPEGLLNAREVGAVWEYTAQIISRHDLSAA